MPATQAQGSASLMAMVEEETWGTQPSVGKSWRSLRFTSESLGSDINTFQSQELRGDRMTAAQLRGNRRADGDFNFEVGPNSHNLILRHALGGDWSKGVSDSVAPYDYTLYGSRYGGTTGVGRLPTGGLTLVKGFTDLDAGATYFVYTGARVDTLTLDFPQEGIVTGVCSVLSAQEAITTTQPWTTLSAVTGDPFESNKSEIYIVPYDASGEPSWGTAIGVITGGRLTIANNLDGNSYVLGSTSRYSIPAGRRAISGSVSMLFTETSYYNDYINGTPVAIWIRFTTDGTYYIDLKLPNVRYAGTKPAPAITGEQGVTIDLPFVALRHEVLETDVIAEARTSELITTT